MRPTQRAAKTGTLLLVVAGLGAAVLHQLPEPADQTIRPTAERDLDTWSMPLDGYVQPGWSETDFAEALLDQPCLRDLGVDFPVPWATVDGLRAASIADETPERGNTSPALAWSRPLSAEAAADRGYHAPSTAGANEDGWRAWAQDPEHAAAFDDVDQDALHRCFDDARRELGTADRDGADQSASITAKRLTYLAAEDARRTPEVRAAAMRWRQCLALTATQELPDDPHGMPTTAMRQAFALEARTVASDDEIALAEHDVACQTSSGYRAALYDAQWNRLLHVTATDAAVLGSADGDQAALADRVAATIERLAPPAPEGVD